MTNYKDKLNQGLTPEEWNELDRMIELTVDLISRDMTPNFSKEDWMAFQCKLL